MSRKNVELVRVVHEGWARGDFGAGADLLSTDFAWEQPAEAVEAGSRRGAEVGQSLRHLFEVYDEYRFEAEEFIDAGNRVFVAGWAKGTAKASRMDLVQRFALVWTVREGALARLQVFTDRSEALEAAGLSE